MAKIDPMYNLLNTILDDKEVVIFLGAGASMEGTQEGKRFPGFNELIDKILKQFGFDHKDKKNRLDNFSEVIKKWEKEKKLTSRLSEYLDGLPGLAHYYLAAFSIALLSEINALLYLTTNYDNLMEKTFFDLERNPGRRFKTIPLSLRFNITGSEFQEIVRKMEDHMGNGRPVILKLFGDLTSQNPVFKQKDMKFQPEVERQMIGWMKKPMIVIGYSFSDRILEELLIAAQGTSPVFLVNPSSKIPGAIKKMDRVHHIKSNFSEFISRLFGIIENREPAIKEKVDKILKSIYTLPEFPDRLKGSEPAIKKMDRDTKSPVIVEQKKKSPAPSGEFQYQEKLVKKILILAANPKMTSRLRLDEEVREIGEGLHRSKNRDRFIIHQKWAVSIRDLRRSLLDYEPQIVHFTGHGREEGILIEFGGFAEPFSTRALSELFKLCSGHVKCVILSGCYSSSQAAAINKHIDYVIGMREGIRDRASIEFAVGFYDALGAGRSVEDAFQFGRAGILAAIPNLPEHLIPILKVRMEQQAPNPISNSNFEELNLM